MPVICFPQAIKSYSTWILIFLRQPLNVDNEYLTLGQRIAKPQKQITFR